MFIYAWNKYSEGASELAEALGAKRIKHENSKFKGKPWKVVINWGSSEPPSEVLKCEVLNHPDAVHIASDKLMSFKVMSREIVPDWTEDLNEALSWVADGDTVCARTILNGHSAQGLILMDKDNPDKFVKAPLYTRYIKKTDEFRIHVVLGKVVDVQKKVIKKEKLNSGEEINWKIRNLDNGFIYQRENITVPDEVKTVGVLAVEELGLDFGAVDIVVDSKTKKPYVLEVNTAPGITGTTVQKYVEAFNV